MTLALPEAATLLVMMTFLLAGTVKGVIGLGLPTVSLAILTVAIDLPSAMVLLLVPSFVTNLWQASVGGNAGLLFRRLWPFLLPAGLCVWIGALALQRIDLALLSVLLGILLIVYAAVSLAGLRFTVNLPQQSWVGPLTGLVNGLLTGMTGSFVVPGVIYLNAIGLTRDQLIQGMGILFTLSTLALALSLGQHDMLDGDQIAASSVALLPAIVGMIIGQRIRRSISELAFRRIFFYSLLVLGIYIALTALVEFIA
jgi:uncharacterized membrane protein YfcA